MLFNSHIFIFVFLPVLLAGWFFFNHKKWYKLAQGYLIGMSLWFYAYLNPDYLWILLAGCLVGYGFCAVQKGYGLCAVLKRAGGADAGSAAGGRRQVRAEDDRTPESCAGVARKLFLVLGIVFHLGLLGYFKYSNFFLENINAVFGSDFRLLSVIMPVGVSFYTFQQLAYLIDCYRDDAPLYGFWDYLLFMVYFPQVLQGPILLHGELIPQFHEEKRRQFDAGRFAAGIQHFVIGLGKKVLLADNLAKAVNFGYENVASLDSVSAILLAAGYLVELYFDFSGYCDMAVGLGKMVGLEIVENFDSPFKSASVKEFWRRWHITLGRFFTKYVYIPLGGSRRGKVRTIVNTLIIFLLSGLWHGAAWTFVFWGLLHGIGVAWDSLKLFELPKKWMRQAVTFLYVCLAFVFFRAESIAQGFSVIKAMFVPKWNGFLFQMAEALDLSEFYAVTKALSMYKPALLPYCNMALFLVFTAVCSFVLSQKRTADLVSGAKLTKTYSFALAFVFAWSVLSMAGVSTFLYFSF